MAIRAASHPPKAVPVATVGAAVDALDTVAPDTTVAPETTTTAPAEATPVTADTTTTTARPPTTVPVPVTVGDPPPTTGVTTPDTPDVPVTEPPVTTVPTTVPVVTTTTLPGLTNTYVACLPPGYGGIPAVQMPGMDQGCVPGDAACNLIGTLPDGTLAMEPCPTN